MKTDRDHGITNSLMLSYMEELEGLDISLVIEHSTLGVSEFSINRSPKTEVRWS